MHSSKFPRCFYQLSFYQLALAMAACLGLSSFSILSAQSNSNPAATDIGEARQYLDTGEFTLAIEAAQSASTQLGTDQALAAIAQQQQAAGAVTAAVDTLDGIVDDTIRAQQGGGGFGGGGGGQRGGGGGGGLGVGGGGGGGGQGGQGSQADFDTLIELITTTVDPDTWEEVGGQGTIAGFPGGVFVDAVGVLQRTKLTDKTNNADPLSDELTRRKNRASIEDDGQLIAISLPRLEKALQLRRAANLPPTSEQQTLGGLGRVESLHVYPETGDIVISGRCATSEEATLRLDDLAVVAAAVVRGNGKFGCSINPRADNLQRTQQFLNNSVQRALKPGERPQWLRALAAHMGRQDIEVFGIPATTSTAQVLVQADYHMKLVGMGLAKAPAEMQTYLDSIDDFQDDLPPLDVLRWWFNANFDGIAVNDEQTIYRLLGQAVKVSSENELLDELGRRVHTGQSHPINSQFAAEFTKHFDDLATRYPFYARLRGIFELATATAIIVEDDLPARVGWQPSTLVNDDGYLSPPVPAATEVDSIIGHRVLNETKIVAAVSGGVNLDTKSVVARRKKLTPSYADQEQHTSAQPKSPRGRNEDWTW